MAVYWFPMAPQLGAVLEFLIGNYPWKLSMNFIKAHLLRVPDALFSTYSMSLFLWSRQCSRLWKFSNIQKGKCLHSQGVNILGVRFTSSMSKALTWLTWFKSILMSHRPWEFVIMGPLYMLRDLNEIPFSDYTWSWDLLQKSAFRLRSNKDPAVRSSGFREDRLESPECFSILSSLTPHLHCSLGHAVFPLSLRWKDMMMGGCLTSTQRDHFELRVLSPSASSLGQSLGKVWLQSCKKSTSSWSIGKHAPILCLCLPGTCYVLGALKVGRTPAR